MSFYENLVIKTQMIFHGCGAMETFCRGENTMGSTRKYQSTSRITDSLPNARYVSVNAQYDFLPEQIENKGFSIKADIAQVLNDVRFELTKEVEGNWLTMQCEKPCHDTIYPSLELAKQLAASEKNGRIPSELIPRCTVVKGK